MNRDIFAQKALAEIPKILTLLDRNPHSPTYGCFDRNYWHYKIIDFPCGMAQEFVWPLALVYSTDVPGNPFYHKEVIRQWVYAAICFAAKSSHRDGSCDDYYPLEKATGATAFSLLACMESYKTFELEDERLIEFFRRRADWLAGHYESGRLTNHEALTVLCLEVISDLLRTSQWQESKRQRLERVLSWQDKEGWFQEYEGCDPGYHSLAISLLAQIYERNRENEKLRAALSGAVDLAAEFVHPDGTYGGEYGSRNTNNFFPHGFELVGRWKPQALAINDRFSEALSRELTPCYSDDHILGHHLWNYLLAWRDYVAERPPVPERKKGRMWLKSAKILIDRRENTEIYIALNKGGVFKLFRDGQLVCSDTQFSLQVGKNRKTKNAVGHLVDDYDTCVSDDSITVRGRLGRAKQKQMNPFNLMVLRIVMFSIGRLCPNLIRRLLQKLLITGKQPTDFHFERTFTWTGQRWRVSDRLDADDWKDVKAVGIGCDQTSIYVVMSRTFHTGQLAPFLDLTAELKKLKSGESLIMEREL